MSSGTFFSRLASRLKQPFSDSTPSDDEIHSYISERIQMPLVIHARDDQWNRVCLEIIDHCVAPDMRAYALKILGEAQLEAKRSVPDWEHERRKGIRAFHGDTAHALHQFGKFNLRPGRHKSDGESTQ